MKRSWPLKVRFGFYAAALSTLALVVAMLALRPLIYRHQLSELDEQFETDAAELFRDVENFAGISQDPRKPWPDRAIPVGLRRRFIYATSIDNKTVYHSKNLQGEILKGKPGSVATIMLNGRTARIGTYTHGFYTLHIGTRLGTVEDMQDDLLVMLLWLSPCMAAVVFGCGWLLGGHALRPVTELTAAAENVDATSPDARLPLPDARDEIYRLTEVLNKSFERFQQSFASEARFSADAAHQIKTPLSVLRAGIDSLLSQRDLTTEMRTELEALLKQTRRLTTLTQDLLLLAQIDAGRLKLEAEEIDLTAMAKAMVDDLEILCAHKALTMENLLPPHLTAAGDARRVALILQCISENAAKYTPASGGIRITGGVEGRCAYISVANSGPAIPQGSHDRIFERFRREGQGENIPGHGLGLNIARSLARAQGGDIKLVRSDGQWTEFVFTLPAPALETTAHSRARTSPVIVAEGRRSENPGN